MLELAVVLLHLKRAVAILKLQFSFQWLCITTGLLCYMSLQLLQSCICWHHVFIPSTARKWVNWYLACLSVQTSFYVHMFVKLFSSLQDENALYKYKLSILVHVCNTCGTVLNMYLADRHCSCLLYKYWL